MLMKAYIKVLTVLLFVASTAHSGVVDDFIAQKDVTVFLSKDKKFHEESCTDRPKVGTRMHFNDAMENPELFAADCIDSPKFQELYQAWIQIRLPALQETHDARKRLLKAYKDSADPISKAQQMSAKKAYRSYVVASNKIGLRYADTALVELLKNSMGDDGKKEGDATPEQKTKLKKLFVSAYQQCRRDKLSGVNIHQQLVILALTENVEREAKSLKALKDRVK